MSYLQSNFVIFLCDCYVVLTSFDISTSAPLRNNSLTTVAWPSEDAANRGLSMCCNYIRTIYDERGRHHPKSIKSKLSATANNASQLLNRDRLLNQSGHNKILASCESMSLVTLNL